MYHTAPALVKWTVDQGDGVYPSFIEAGLQTFQYSASAPHNYYQLGYMDVYITKSGWDSSAKLKWQDLEETPFCRKAGDIGGMSNHETFDCDVPARSGNHIIYVVWQRADSDEAFYSCSDVIFGGPSSTTASDFSTVDTSTTSTTSTTGWFCKMSRKLLKKTWNNLF